MTSPADDSHAYPFGSDMTPKDLYEYEQRQRDNRLRAQGFNEGIRVALERNRAQRQRDYAMGLQEGLRANPHFRGPQGPQYPAG